MDNLVSLVVRSVLQPRDVARELLALPLSREFVMTSFVLVLVLNAIVSGISLIMVPLPPGAPELLQMLFAQPSRLMVLQALLLAGMIVTFTYSGQLIGGRGRLPEIAILLIWMQGLRAVVQLAALLIGFASPGASSFLVTLGTVVGVWIFMNFIDEGHGFNSLFKALGVGFLGVIAISFLLSFVLSTAGLVPQF